MIELTQCDEYGVHYATDTFLTIEDAKDALWQLECALDDATTAARSYTLQGLIADLRQQITEAESET
jgi:hypothetical protein